MSAEITAEVVKATRGKYGLSQKSFAQLLGIGEATIVRYEKGQVPTRANANLILAADDPQFMAKCLEREGEFIPPAQCRRAKEYIYAFVNLKEDEEAGEQQVNKMDEIYGYVLRQEVLNEQAANIIGDIIRYSVRENIDFDDRSNPLVVLVDQLAEIKQLIVGKEGRDHALLDRIGGYLTYLEEFVTRFIDERAVA